ncbi:MAG TPA: HAMP domain-containing sensor histidine kinase [Candidatus Nitrosocosmicus sp.]|nr:HAMP domain-containing sensor histidine kinase [Candidatus Nitrosocosmicus sp.]
MGDNVQTIQNAENALDRLNGLIKNVRSRLDIMMGVDGLTLLSSHPGFSELCESLKQQGGVIRCIVKIPTQKYPDFQVIFKSFTGIKQLDNIRGIVATSESEYIRLNCNAAGTTILNGTYSNSEDLLSVSRTYFDVLFANALPFNTQTLGTLHNLYLDDFSLHPSPAAPGFEINIKSADQLSYFIDNSEFICICSSIDGMLFEFQNYFENFGQIIAKEKSGLHGGIRWLTSIRNKNEIELIKSVAKSGVKIRHINENPVFDFAISNRFFALTTERINKGRMVIDNLFLNDEEANLSFYNMTFEKLWKDGIEFEERITEIEGTADDKIDIVYDSNNVMHRIYKLFAFVKKEILIIIPSTKGFYRSELEGGFKMLNELGFKGIQLKVLTIPDYVNIKETDKIKSKYKNIAFKDLDPAMASSNRILVFDNKTTVVWEVVDDDQQKFTQALGMALFIENIKTSETITVIFDNLWNQSEIHSRLKDANEKLKDQGKMQSRFMDLVAHELRTPLQSILGITEILKNEIKDNDQNFLLRIAISNAKKLHRLSENILDITRLEGNILYLNKERFSLNQLTTDIISDFVTNIEYNKSITFEYRNFDKEYFVFADKFRVGQVIQNLIDNAMRFVRNRGKITLILGEKKIHSKDIVELSVMDDGESLKPEILARLFTKFASDSYYGTGIGLYLCKKIIEAHDGRIWAKNNLDKKGCTFSFGIPQ